MKTHRRIAPGQRGFGAPAATVYLIALFWNLLSACLIFTMEFAPAWQNEGDAES